MPLVNDPPSPPKPAPPPGEINATIAEPGYKHALVDAKVTPLSSLLVHIDGSSWTVDYYSQVLGGSENLSPYQPNQPNVYQQYLLVKKFELKLQGSLSASQDPESTEMTVTGNAIIYPFLKPNYGDMFIADIGDGRAGLFAITSPPTKKTILKETCWEISFELTRYMSQALETDLNKRVVKTTHFVKDFLTYGQNPILADVDLQTKEFIDKYTRQLLNRWLSKFLSVEHRTILVPGQAESTYDPYIVKTMLSLFMKEEHPLLSRVRELNCDGLPLITHYLIWNALMNLDPATTTIMGQRVWLISTEAFSNYPIYDGVYFSGIQKVVYPNMENPTVDGDYVSQEPVTGVDFTDLEDMDWNMASIYQYNVAGGFDDPGQPVQPTVTEEDIPYIHPVVFDDYYVFTANFYNKTPAMQSLLELLANDAIAGNAINKDKLFSLCEDVKNWGRLEQFYYIPVLIILLKILLRRL